MNCLFNGMKQGEFLNELISATGLNGKALLDYLLDRINLDNTNGKATAMQRVSISRNDKGLDEFLSLCYSDTDKFTASLIMQKEFNRYNYIMGDIVVVSPTKFTCKCPNCDFEVRIDCGIKDCAPAYIEVYHPVTENYRGPSVTTIYGVFCHHYIVEDLSAYEI